jgi:uncharacterized protein DUF1706
MPTVRHTRASVLRRVDSEYKALDRAVRALMRERALDRPVPGFGSRARIRRERWTYKDALAHVLAWKRWQIDALRRAPQDPTLRGLTIAQKNRRIYDEWHRRPAEDVVRWHRSLHREIMKALRALPAEVFSAKRSPHWPGDLTGHPEGHRRKHLEAR